MVADPQAHDRFFIRQRVRPIVNQYEVATLADDASSAAEPVCFVEQRRFKLKEELTAFADDTKSDVVFRIKAQQVWDPRAKYDVTDGRGATIGQLRKMFGRSLLRSTWELRDPAGDELAWAQEKSAAIGILRRVKGLLGLVPFVGWIFDLLPIPYHFGYHLGDREIGEVRRLVGIRDRYRLDLAGDAERLIDRRVALALAVGMDAMQAR
jgi:uncharacterized protein YxjI